jgi:hypothetical protein
MPGSAGVAADLLMDAKDYSMHAGKEVSYYYYYCYYGYYYYY